MAKALSSREFNQNTSAARKAAQNGPVFITDRGRDAYVLLTIDDYQRLCSRGPSIVELLAMPGGDDIEFYPPRMASIMKPIDLS